MDYKSSQIKLVKIVKKFIWEKMDSLMIFKQIVICKMVWVNLEFKNFNKLLILLATINKLAILTYNLHGLPQNAENVYISMQLIQGMTTFQELWVGISGKEMILSESP
jgi:hypothetical protein